MSFDFLVSPDPFCASASTPVLPIKILLPGEAAQWLESCDLPIQAQARQTGFSGKAGQCAVFTGPDGKALFIAAGTNAPLKPYDSSVIFDFIFQTFSADLLAGTIFAFDSDLPADDLNTACIGWGLAAYRFDRYKKSETSGSLPKLIWPDKANKNVIEANIGAVCLLRSLINTPANDLGTDELAMAAQQVAKNFKASFKTIVGKDLLKQNFPMIYDVGKASPRPPQLIELNWGDKKHPKLTIVGKGVVFDTGGLNIKPGRYMALMKKDMGGAAHALALAWLIMSLKLPVCLQVLIAAAENSISGEAFRPGDILQSRKGHTVEMKDADAEGRLVVGDALTYGCESNPDLILDFCTLTGAARVALGRDIPAFFSNRENLLDELRRSGSEVDDPVWPLPLWQPYFKDYDSKIADFSNDDETGMAGAIKAGLFLEKFVEPDIDWIHLDIYAWEVSGKPGRPQGGADTGLRAVYRLLEKRYG